MNVLLILLFALLPALAQANNYYTHGSFPATGSAATSAGMRAELDLITAGFDKMPALTGNASRAVIVNGTGTALSLTTGTLTLPGNLTFSGANNVTFTTTGATGLTLPTTGTLGTLAGAEVFTNKSIDLGNNTITGTLAQFNTALSGADFATLAGSESLTNKTINLSSNTLTGTLAQFNTALSDADVATIAGSENLTNKTVTSPILAGAPVFPDNVFTVGGSADSTKKVRFEVDGITTGTTRAVTIQDADGTLAYANAADTWSTGDVKLTLKTSADSGWVLMNDGTIGSATSGATTRANADTSTLYTLIWNNCIDQWCPVSTGRGANAAADFAANKPLALPKTLGRALAGYGVGVVTASGTDGGVDIGAAESFTVDSNNTKWITGMPVVFTLSSGTITGLTSGNTYYIIRSSATLVQLASTLANAQNGTAINMTAKSSPVWTLTHTYTTRVMGEAVGEDAHAMSETELLAHTHSMSAVTNTAGGVAAAGGDKGTTTNTGSRGGNAAMNIMQPTLFLNVMVKL